MKVERIYFPVGGAADSEAGHLICVVAELAHG